MYNPEKCFMSSLGACYKIHRVPLFDHHSLVKRTSNMFSLFLGIFGTCLALMGMCQAGNLEHSNLAPLSIVYTVYPYYNSETLLGIVKGEDTLQLSNNVVPLGRGAEAQEARNSANAGSQDELTGNSNNRDSSRNESDDSGRQRNEQAAEITYWPPVQRGAAPKPRLGRASGLQQVRQKNV